MKYHSMNTPCWLLLWLELSSSNVCLPNQMTNSCAKMWCLFCSKRPFSGCFKLNLVQFWNGDAFWLNWVIRNARRAAEFCDSWLPRQSFFFFRLFWTYLFTMGKLHWFWLFERNYAIIANVLSSCKLITFGSIKIGL